jgi:hypothetical protein
MQASNAVGRAGKEEVGYGLGNGAVGAEGGRREFEAVKVSVEPDVTSAELGEDTALRPAQPLIHLLQRFRGGCVVEGGDASVPR